MKFRLHTQVKKENSLDSDGKLHHIYKVLTMTEEGNQKGLCNFYHLYSIYANLIVDVPKRQCGSDWNRRSNAERKQ